MKKIPIGISSCLLGDEVRFDSGHKRDAYITGTLSRYFDFRPVCPEVAIGLGIPRPPIHLVKEGSKIKCVGVKNPEVDFTEELTNLANRLQPQIVGLCGYILKKDSPSCGLERVKVYGENMPARIGSGIFAERMMRNNPLLPVEEEGRLGDPQLRENFIQRVYILHRWKNLLKDELTAEKLIEFHARHKLIIMSHGDYAEPGRLLSNLNQKSIENIARQYITLLMKLLKEPASRNRHVNVLQHIQGYLKKGLSVDDKAELREIIERYHQGEIPLIVPLTLLKHHFRKCPDPYIDNSYYLSPYPQEMQLINQF